MPCKTNVKNFTSELFFKRNVYNLEVNLILKIIKQKYITNKFN